MEAPVRHPTEPEMHPTEPESNPTVAHEETDADTRAITRFGIGLAFVLVICNVLIWWLFDHLAARESRLSPAVPAIVKLQAPREPPEPRLQGNPQLDMRNMLNEEDAVLNHYGWVDPDRGIVRIPVQQAIDIVAQKGLPQFKATGPTASGSTPSERNPGETPASQAFGAKPPTQK
jgi:hypothetical protein